MRVPWVGSIGVVNIVGFAKCNAFECRIPGTPMCTPRCSISIACSISSI
jgi:hypothetical protein